MHDLVLVVSDLYVSQEAPERELPHGVALPGLQHAARFGSRSEVAGGWRPWLARWLIADQRRRSAGANTAGANAGAGPRVDEDRELPDAAPATVAAAALATQQARTVWMATPVHLVAGLTSLHLDRRSTLRLSTDDLTALAAEFRRVFHDSGFVLEPLASGEFLLLGPQMPVAQTLEPARAMGNSIADAQPRDPALRRVGAEIEMWLHEHPINEARTRRGEMSVTGLWLWGGGPMPALRDTRPASEAHSDIAFGNDAYLQGLCVSLGKKVFPLPQQLTDVFGYPEVRRAALVIEIGPMLHSNSRWTFIDAIAQIDRAFIAPAVEALGAAKVERLVILANDHELTLRARDRFRLWRRVPAGLSGLQ